jgi:hypothetical protein
MPNFVLVSETSKYTCIFHHISLDDFHEIIFVVVIFVLASIGGFESLKDENENVFFRILVGRRDREHVGWSAIAELRTVQSILRQTLLQNFCHEQVVSLEEFLNVFESLAPASCSGALLSCSA